MCHPRDQDEDVEERDGGGDATRPYTNDPDRVGQCVDQMNQEGEGVDPRQVVRHVNFGLNRPGNSGDSVT